MLPQQVYRPIQPREVPPHLWVPAKVLLKQFPELLAEDHVLPVGDACQDAARERVFYGRHEQRVLGLAIDDALENVVSSLANAHEQVLRRWLEGRRRRQTEAPACILLLLLPIRSHVRPQLFKTDSEAELDVHVEAALVVVLDVAEYISSMGRLCKALNEVQSNGPSVVTYHVFQITVVEELSAKAQKLGFAHLPRPRVVIVNVGLKEVPRHLPLHSRWLQVPSQCPGFLSVPGGH